MGRGKARIQDFFFSFLLLRILSKNSVFSYNTHKNEKPKVKSFDTR